ncbi:hypothetical protein O181_012064 [Austropuccinia psidii MF-1]|uniref:HlyIII-domain-containing protein n=1 Tax=Austropuccinia psidii MF-1 TaxID=1389203 RepID=A0A9Q3BTZ0_9BASI|nr:hypothetical protein [Austropuccinia psidii MF-1]
MKFLNLTDQQNQQNQENFKNLKLRFRSKSISINQDSINLNHHQSNYHHHHSKIYRWIYQDQIKNPQSDHSILNQNHQINLNFLISSYDSQPITIKSLDLPESLSLDLRFLYQSLLNHLNLIDKNLNSFKSSNHHQEYHQEYPQNSLKQPHQEPVQESHHQIHKQSHQAQSQKLIIQSSHSASKNPSSLHFLNEIFNYTHQLKLDLFKISTLSPFYPSNHQPLLGLFDLFSIDHIHQLIKFLIIHSQNLDKLSFQLSLISHSQNHFINLPFKPTNLPQPISSLSSLTGPSSSSSTSSTSTSTSFQSNLKPHHHQSNHLENSISLANLRQYFISESERLTSLLPHLPTNLSDSFTQSSNQLSLALRACKEEAQAVFHDGEAFIRQESEKLKEWYDAETEKLKFALQTGASRLLTYHELPEQWKNNQFILRGYRFIPLDRWHHLLLSGIQWHNETINIHTHLFGTISLFYLLFFLWPITPHTNPQSSSWSDRAISLLFLVCAIKCLVCSTAWHLFAGCGTLGPFRRLACVDYVGISGLIAASVISMEYYGFYCRPILAASYMSFTFLMGIIGMILPFQPFFDRPENKGIRIVFFVSLASSALIPLTHMSYLYGLIETFSFYRPALLSVVSYLSGLVFYATNWPERVKPGWVFDTLFHSHQFWHVAIVIAIWLHWRAIGFIHDLGREGFSCSTSALERHKAMGDKVFGLGVLSWLF